MAILIGVTVVLVIAAVLLLIWLLKRERTSSHGGHLSAPPMVFLPPEGSAPPIVRAPYVPQPTPVSQDGATRPQLIQEHPVADVTTMASVVGSTVVSSAAAGENSMLALNRRRVPRNRPSAGDGLAALGTLRMLPGRLVPEDRNALRDDIRFIALDSSGEQRFTVGRGEGPLHEHIQVAAPTVSRRHATLLYRDSIWSISNLSETNPVRVNGAELRSGESIPLAEGDTVELGDLVLRFRN